MADWYSTGEAQQMVQEFHGNLATHPREMQEATRRHYAIMTELIDYFRERNAIKRAEYTESAYEGLQVAANELEFVAKFILKGGEHLDVEINNQDSLYGHLKPVTQVGTTHFRTVLSWWNNLLPFKVRDKFYAELEKWKNTRETRNPVLRGEITLHKNGPAIKKIVYKDGKEWYCVDLVPAFEVTHHGEREIYIAKPKDNPDELWRHSFSVEEKAKLGDIDAHDNGCRKKIIRILKVVRDRVPGLHKLVSFYIKCKIIEMSELHMALNWSEGNLAVRLRDVMLELSNSLAVGYLEHPHDKSVNILEDSNHEVLQNVADRLRQIATSEQVAKEVFRSDRGNKPQSTWDGVYIQSMVDGSQDQNNSLNQQNNKGVTESARNRRKIWCKVWCFIKTAGGYVGGQINGFFEFLMLLLAFGYVFTLIKSNHSNDK